MVDKVSWRWGGSWRTEYWHLYMVVLTILNQLYIADFQTSKMRCHAFLSLFEGSITKKVVEQ